MRKVRETPHIVKVIITRIDFSVKDYLLNLHFPKKTLDIFVKLCYNSYIIKDKGEI